MSEISRRPRTDPKPERREFKEKEPGFISLEIGAGGSLSPFLRPENIKRYKSAHLMRVDLFEGGHSDEELLELHQKYGGFGGSGSLLQAQELDQEKIQNAGENFKGQVEYLRCDAAQIPVPTEAVGEVYMANVFSAPGFKRQDNQKVISEVARVLRPHGELIIAETYTSECSLEGVDRDSSRRQFEQAITKFANQFLTHGFKIKSIEFPKFSQQAYEEMERGSTCDSYLSKYPNGKMLFGTEFIPWPPAPYLNVKFLIVLEKE